MTKNTESLPFHLKYRPTNLDTLIGHEKIVTRLKGVIASKRIPNAILLTGPSSAGKTTIARAFVASLFGLDTIGGGHRDFHEFNAADTRGIDDIRDLLRVSKQMPSSAPKRVILIDEAQQITGPAGQALLKPLENPPPSTLFILGTMEPEKMLTATKNRCSVFNLEPQDETGLTKYIKRIVKRENLSYVDEAIVKRVVENSNGEFRTAASTLEALDQYAKGSGKKSFSKEDVDAALETVDSNDEELAVRVMACMYAENFTKAHRAVIDVSEPFKFINTLIRLNTFLLNTEVLKGDTHKSIWFSKQNNDMKASVLKVIKRQNILAFGVVQQEFLDMKLKSLSFALPEHALISSTIFSVINCLKTIKENK